MFVYNGQAYTWCEKGVYLKWLTGGRIKGEVRSVMSTITLSSLKQVYLRSDHSIGKLIGFHSTDVVCIIGGLALW